MPDPWRWWDAATIARITGCPLAAVQANWPLIADALEVRGIYERDVCLGVLPTVSIETASTFRPVREAFWMSEEWRRANLRYWPHYGRGFPQITWEANYREAGEAIGVDLLGDPDRALDPPISADVLAWFWATKGVRAKDGSRYYTLVDLCRERDWEWVRRVFQGGVDGLDRLIAMASALDAYATVKEPVMPTYNPSQPPERQLQDWTCSIRSTAWVLKSLGLPVDIGDLQDEMSPTYVTPALGLLDKRGYGVAAVLKAHLPAEWADRVHVFENISWDELRSLAGSGPIALGLHGAYHWIDVARVRDDGDLDAANPAPGYPLAAPIGDVLSRAEFDRFGPASAVWVQVPVAVAEPTAPVEIAPDDKLPGLISAVAYLADDVAAIEDRDTRLAEARRVREQYVGKRPAA